MSAESPKTGNSHNGLVVDTITNTRMVGAEFPDDSKSEKKPSFPGGEDVSGYEDINKISVIDEFDEFDEFVEVQHEQIFNIVMVEQKPTFPGGYASLYKWLNTQINYPTDASEAGIQGKVIVSFVIEKDGSITNVQVVRKKHPALDAEALRVIKKMPRWKPGYVCGKPVRVLYPLPITFKLPEEEQTAE